MSEKIIFWAAFFVAYTLNAITGFAGNIIAMPVGMQTLGIQESIASLNVAGFLACGLLAIQKIASAHSIKGIAICKDLC